MYIAVIIFAHKAFELTPLRDHSRGPRICNIAVLIFVHKVNELPCST